MQKYLFFILLFGLIACNRQTPPVALDFNKIPYEHLSDYHFFKDDIRLLEPNARVVPYDLNSALFTDYAHKARFVWMPEGVSAQYSDSGLIAFPNQTVLIKTFYYPKDFQKPNEDKQIIETRLLVKNKDKWEAYHYLWDDNMQEATLDIVGDTRKMEWKDTEGKMQTTSYIIPNKNQCKSCHNSKETLQPIGPKARNLNKDFRYSDTESQNQLKKWASVGYLQGLPAENLPFMPAWNQEAEGNVQQRAMAYLDVNCGHCHNPNGPGGSSGLTLTYEETNLHAIGLCKSPVASGRASAGLLYDIHPHSPDSSILISRMKSLNPGEMMPEVGRTMVHAEALALLETWISEIDGKCKD